MATTKTILSAGEIIVGLLSQDPEVTSRANKVYAVVEDESVLPYVTYRRLSLGDEAVKSRTGAKTAVIEVLCFTEDYTEGVELAEAVNHALDGQSAATDDGLVMRSCHLTDSTETWQDDAFVQRLLFEIRI